MERTYGYLLNNLIKAGFFTDVLSLDGEEGQFGECRYYVKKGDPELIALIIPAGYCQAAAYEGQQLFKDGTLRGVKNTVIIVERTGMGTPHRLKRQGCMGVGRQAREFVAIIQTLQKAGVIASNQQFVLLAHSLVPYLAGYLARRNGRMLKEIISIAGVPLIPWIMLFNPWFWYAAVSSLPSAAKSIWKGEGSMCPPRSARFFFCSASKKETNPEIEEYLQTLQPDAGILFPQILLGYGILWGWDLLIARFCKGWKGSLQLVRCRKDWLMTNWAMRATAWIYQKAIGGVRSYEINEPHSWFVGQKRAPETISTLRHVLKQAGIEFDEE